MHENMEQEPELQTSGYLDLVRALLLVVAEGKQRCIISASPIVESFTCLAKTSIPFKIFGQCHHLQIVEHFNSCMQC